jgi:hypothetical protein
MGYNDYINEKNATIFKINMEPYPDQYMITEDSIFSNYKNYITPIDNFIEYSFALEPVRLSTYVIETIINDIDKINNLKILLTHIYKRMLELLNLNNRNIVNKVYIDTIFKSIDDYFGQNTTHYIYNYIKYCVSYIFKEGVVSTKPNKNTEYDKYIIISPTDNYDNWNDVTAKNFYIYFYADNIDSNIDKLNSESIFQYTDNFNDVSPPTIYEHINYHLSIEPFIPSLIYVDIYEEIDKQYTIEIIQIMKLTVLHHLIDIMYNNEKFNLGMDMTYVNQLYDSYYFSLSLIKFTGGKNKTLTLTTYYDIYMRNKTKYLNFENNVFYQQYLTNKDKYEKLKKS